MKPARAIKKSGSPDLIRRLVRADSFPCSKVARAFLCLGIIYVTSSASFSLHGRTPMIGLGKGVVAEDANFAVSKSLPYFSGALIDEVYKKSTPAPEYHPKGRICDSRSIIRSQYTPYWYRGDEWIRYYYYHGDLSADLQYSFENNIAVKRFHDKYLKKIRYYGFEKVDFFWRVIWCSDYPK